MSDICTSYHANGRIGSRLRDTRLVTLVGMGARDYRSGGVR